MHRSHRLIAGLLLLLAATGCGEGNARRDAQSTPKRTFREIWQACIEGRFAAAHSRYSFRLQRVIPVQQIADTYSNPQTRETARRMLQGARFHVDRYSGSHAFATVRWSDGTKQRLTFVHENEVWKLDITPVPPGSTP